ncbi:cytochrome P450 26B1 [Pimephales promelas]|uniref:cytochrome P450 26B1 n=1 Tax=Pimephales promelas TaxID=90988 RepID=UPI001955A947|nr:cytochrome P450 26B1 [Pimephales promelas]XP_039526792.1 cytochrome P450 26B1 [Pimephales promelas]XP_039526801.1 cytochrome P450 26B1 [Pimephales promelas]KAG1972867.1 cytochrome P450 26B1 [Pimephales promelas]
MFGHDICLVSSLLAAACAVLPVLLLLVVSRLLWEFRWSITRDRACKLPLPQGSMGWPLVGETFHWLFQGSSFHISRREKHGNVFKTHLLGKPLIRVTGAENIRKILLGEHTVVCTQWPQSTRIILGPNTLVNSVGDLHKRKRKILAKVFSRGALEAYLTRLQDVVKSEIGKWCTETGSVDVYAAAKSLTFRIAVQVLLGLHLDEQQIASLSKTFEQLMNNLFSLPIDTPISGMRKGIKAREILHSAMERIIEEKLKKQQASDYCDAFDYMLSSGKENDYDLTMQELKETAVELIFAAHSTTASASTSLILQLLRHPDVCRRAGAELESEGLISDAHGSCRSRCYGNIISEESDAAEKSTSEYRSKTNKSMCFEEGEKEEGCRSRTHVPYLSLEKLSQLSYLDCVVKEVLRFLPPVSGGYRTVLQTFELNGYQIPKGWSVMYSIRDTHETAEAYQNPELFDPDRFCADRDNTKTERFSYVPFGGGVRRCIGRELALIVLKTLAVELLATADCTLATETYPRMQTVPIVHPVNGLHVFFNYRTHGIERNRRESTHI